VAVNLKWSVPVSNCSDFPLEFRPLNVLIRVHDAQWLPSSLSFILRASSSIVVLLMFLCR
jgi:hypothetical protein